MILVFRYYDKTRILHLWFRRRGECFLVSFASMCVMMVTLTRRCVPGLCIRNISRLASGFMDLCYACKICLTFPCIYDIHMCISNTHLHVCAECTCMYTRYYRFETVCLGVCLWRGLIFRNQLSCGVQSISCFFSCTCVDFLCMYLCICRCMRLFRFEWQSYDIAESVMISLKGSFKRTGKVMISLNPITMIPNLNNTYICKCTDTDTKLWYRWIPLLWFLGMCARFNNRIRFRMVILKLCMNAVFVTIALSKALHEFLQNLQILALLIYIWDGKEYCYWCTLNRNLKFRIKCVYIYTYIHTYVYCVLYIYIYIYILYADAMVLWVYVKFFPVTVFRSYGMCKFCIWNAPFLFARNNVLIACVFLITVASKGGFQCFKWYQVFNSRTSSFKSRQIFMLRKSPKQLFKNLRNDSESWLSKSWKIAGRRFPFRNGFQTQDANH